MAKGQCDQPLVAKDRWPVFETLSGVGLSVMIGAEKGVELKSDLSFVGEQLKDALVLDMIVDI